jgi:type I restriction enzyme S subunit
VSVSEWREVRLGDLVTFQRGHDLPKAEMKEGPYPVVGSNGIIGYHSKYTTEAPCITIGRSGNVGNPFLSKCKTWAHNTTLYIKEFKNTDPIYIYYLLKTLDLGYYAVGSAVPTLNRNHIHPILISVPESIEEQRSIAATLSALDDMIELNNQINKTLEEMAQAIFKSWFVDFEPFRDGEFEESELGLIPKGWRVGKLDDVLSEIETGNRPKGGVAGVESGIPSIGAENVLGLGKYDYSKEKYVSEEFYNSMKKGKLKDWDVLLYKDGAQLGRKTMFALGFPHKKCCVNSHVFILRSNSRMNQCYLYFWLDQDYMTQKIIGLNANSAQPGINQPAVKGLPILIPPIDVLERFDDLVVPIIKNLFSNCLENNILVSIRDTLLPKLMSGEIRVPVDEVM